MDHAAATGGKDRVVFAVSDGVRREAYLDIGRYLLYRILSPGALADKHRDLSRGYGRALRVEIGLQRFRGAVL